MTAESTISKSSQLSSVDVKGEAVILDIDSGNYYGLDGVGARVWELLERPRTLGEICDVVLDEYEVSREVAESDIRGLIAELGEKGLVKVEG